MKNLSKKYGILSIICALAAPFVVISLFFTEVAGSIMVGIWLALLIIAIISGTVFILIGLLEIPKIRELYIEKQKVKSDVNQLENIDSDKDNLQENFPSKLSRIKNNAYLAGFIFIFVMELGDKTQILTITLTSIYSSPFEV